MMTNKDHVIDGRNFGKVICLHSHGSLWIKGPLPYRKLSEELSLKLPPLLGGVSPVKIEPWGDTLRSTYHWSCYNLKSPIDLKRYWKMKEREELVSQTPIKVRKRSEEIRSEYTKLSKFRRHMRRLAEIESHIPIGQLMFAGGDGKTLRSKTITTLKAKVDGYLSCPIPPTDDTPPLDCYSQQEIERLWPRERDDQRIIQFDHPTILL